MKKKYRIVLYIVILIIILILISFVWYYFKNDYSVYQDNHNYNFVEKIKNSFYNNIIEKNRYNIIFNGLKNTILISFLSILFGTAIGAVICFMNMSKNIAFKCFAKLYIRFFRGIPIVLLLLLTYYVVLASVRITSLTVSIIVFSVYFGAYASEIFRSGIKSVGNGQIEAGLSMGFTKFQTLLYIVLPQTIKIIFPVYKGVQDLTRATDIIRSQTFDAFFPLILTTILYFIVIGILILILNSIEKRINPRKEV